MNLESWILSVTIIISLVALFISFKVLKITSGELKEIVGLTPIIITVSISAVTTELLRHLGIIMIQGAYDIFELIWLLLMITLLSRTHKLFTSLAK